MTTKAKKIELTQEELREIFNYDPLTGVFNWKIKPSDHIGIAAVAGTLNRSTGHFHITYKGRHYYTHRLAWIYVYGEIPEGRLLDHKDTNGANNKIDNLRLSTKSENMMNVDLRSDNKSGHKGVTWDKVRGRW